MKIVTITQMLPQIPYHTDLLVKIYEHFKFKIQSEIIQTYEEVL